jgi:microcin C transport system substrate-binding protein
MDGWRAEGSMRSQLKKLVLVLALAVSGALLAIALPATAAPRHGLSIFGDLKYAADFKHFDYVNPDAPKGGRATQIGPSGVTTFDSFNNFILKGDAAQGLELVFDSLMARALDEPDAVYGLVAEWSDVADDGMSVTFKLRPEAKFADGSPVTADDVVFSFDTLKAKGHPSIALALRDVVAAEALGAATVRYTFQGRLVRDLPVTVAALPILSKAYYSTHEFDKTTLDPPLGSGPYKIGDYKAGTFVSYLRREDYWAKDLPVNRGLYNFDEVRYEYYRDRGLELENLLSGNFDFREEFTSKDWATGYDKPAVKDGRVLLQTLADERPSGAQGFFINTRREKFKDVRVRKALDLAFDFEWSNRNLFFGLYKRTASFFENSDMKASGPPSPEELALLEPFRDKLPPDVFGEPYAPPVTDGSGNMRDQLREAARLLAEAGWTQTPDGLKNAKGERLTVEILDFDPTFERIVGPYIKNLRLIGIDTTERRVDPSQYERRVKDFDFDLTTQRYSLRLTPGVELKNYWGSEAAETSGSFNLAGIADPVLDQVIERVITAKSRAELVAATRAADRILRAGHYWVPQWYKGAHNIAFWNKFGWPATKPKYERGALETWWYDAERSAKLQSD